MVFMVIIIFLFWDKEMTSIVWRQLNICVFSERVWLSKSVTAFYVLNIFMNKQININPLINKCVIKFKLCVFFTSTLNPLNAELSPTCWHY
jgi:hypothetical protein